MPWMPRRRRQNLIITVKTRKIYPWEESTLTRFYSWQWFPAIKLNGKCLRRWGQFSLHGQYFRMLLAVLWIFVKTEGGGDNIMTTIYNGRDWEKNLKSPAFYQKMNENQVDDVIHRDENFWFWSESTVTFKQADLASDWSAKQTRTANQMPSRYARWRDFWHCQQFKSYSLRGAVKK